VKSKSTHAHRATLFWSRADAYLDHTAFKLLPTTNTCNAPYTYYRHHIMAPKSQGNGVPDRETGFEPPPSTMAAVLIKKLSNTNKPSRQSDHDELKALMGEVSDVENNGAEFETDEAKVSHKQKLLYLLARTVLEKLSSDDPFMDTTKLVSQASDALDVFVAIIKEAPGVLAYSSSADTVLQGRGQEPLWLWLFPRILTLLGRRHCDNLTEKIKDFFYVSFQAVSRSPKLWNLTSLFFSYLKECAASLSLRPRLALPSINKFLSYFKSPSTTNYHISWYVVKDYSAFR